MQSGLQVTYGWGGTPLQSSACASEVVIASSFAWRSVFNLVIASLFCAAICLFLNVIIVDLTCRAKLEALHMLSNKDLYVLQIRHHDIDHSNKKTCHLDHLQRRIEGTMRSSIKSIKVPSITPL